MTSSAGLHFTSLPFRGRQKNAFNGKKTPRVGSTERGEIIVLFMKYADLWQSSCHRHRHYIRSVARLRNNICRQAKTTS